MTSTVATSRASTYSGTWYVALAVVAALNTAVSLYYYVRIVRAMFIDEPNGDVVVRPHLGYQIMLGAFSAALILFSEEVDLHR